MKLAFSTLGAPEWSASSVIQRASTLGLDGIEWRVVNGRLLDSSFGVRAAWVIGRDTAAAGLEVAAVGSGLDLAAPPTQRDNVVSATRRMIEIAAAMGAEFLRVFPGAHRPDEPAIGWLHDAVTELADDIRASGVRLAFEVHDSREAPGIRGRSCSAFLAEALDKLPADLVGIQWDVANPYLEGEPAEETWRNIGSRLLYLHLKDMSYDGGRGWRYVHVGAGQLPLESILDWVGGCAFDGWVSFEWERYWEPALDGADIAVPHFVAYMHDYFARR